MIILPNGRPADSTERDQMQAQQPWMVQLMVSPGLGQDPFQQTVFIRGAAPGDAGNMAYALWVRWFRTERKIPKWERYPTVEMNGSIVAIDEGDWDYFYQEAKRWAFDRRNSAQPVELNKAGYAGMPPHAWCVERFNMDTVPFRLKEHLAHKPNTTTVEVGS